MEDLESEFNNIADFGNFDICDYQRSKAVDQGGESDLEQNQDEEMQYVERENHNIVKKRQLKGKSKQFAIPHTFLSRSNGFQMNNQYLRQSSQNSPSLYQDYEVNSFRKRCSQEILPHSFSSQYQELTFSDCFQNKNYQRKQMKEESDHISNCEGIGPWELEENNSGLFTKDLIHSLQAKSQFKPINNNQNIEQSEKSKDSPNQLKSMKNVIFRGANRLTKLVKDDEFSQQNWSGQQKIERQQIQKQDQNAQLSSRILVKKLDEPEREKNSRQFKRQNEEYNPLDFFVRKMFCNQSSMQTQQTTSNANQSAFNFQPLNKSQQQHQSFQKVNNNQDESKNGVHDLKNSLAYYLKEQKKVQTTKNNQDGNINQVMLMSQHLNIKNTREAQQTSSEKEIFIQNDSFSQRQQQEHLYTSRESEPYKNKYKKLLYHPASSNNSCKTGVKDQAKEEGYETEESLKNEKSGSIKQTTHSYSTGSTRDFSEQQVFVHYDQFPQYQNIIKSLRSKQRELQNEYSSGLSDVKLKEIAKIFLKKNLDCNKSKDCSEQINKLEEQAILKEEYNSLVIQNNVIKKKIQSLPQSQHKDRKIVKYKPNVLEYNNSMGFQNQKVENCKQDQSSSLPFRYSKSHVGNINLQRHNQQIKDKEKKLKEQKEEGEMQRFIKQMESSSIQFHVSDFSPFQNSQFKPKSLIQKSCAESGVGQNMRIQGIKGINRQNKSNPKFEQNLKNLQSQSASPPPLLQPSQKTNPNNSFFYSKFLDYHDNVKSSNSNQQQINPLQNKSSIAAFNFNNNNNNNINNGNNSSNNNISHSSNNTNQNIYFNSNSPQDISQKFNRSYVGFSQLLSKSSPIHQNSNNNKNININNCKQHSPQNQYSTTLSLHQSPLPEKQTTMPTQKETLFFDYINLK